MASVYEKELDIISQRHANSNYNVTPHAANQKD